MNRHDFQALASELPEAREALNRLSQLTNPQARTRIAVFGKYNHGKSTLLNALVGREIFKASDRRETQANQEFSHNGVLWIDTPGLDADIRGKDDRLARLGADELADYLFLVHNIKTGELDRSELDLYQKMMARYPDSKNRMVLVLTQIDQLSPAEGERVNQIIQAQLPGITVIPVSALRYQRGIAEGREKFIELSGITRLLARTKQLKKDLKASRQREVKHLRSRVKKQFQQRLQRRRENLAEREDRQHENRCGFVSALDRTLNNIAKFG